MTIANYIAGARGIFEFIRFDQKKPGILSKLGPITNDAVGGLIAGCSSNMYSQALRHGME
jgi:phosphatidylglycerophosphatase A